ncbi:MAG: DUF192 domain-containing protein [Acidimicrobiia bacterium]
MTTRRWGPLALGIGLAVVLAIAVGVLLAEPDPATRATTVPPVIGPTTETTAAAAHPLDAFEHQTIVVSGDEWEVAVATDRDQRAQGLMGVTDLGGLDGMLFVWDADVASAFVMRDTLLPLDIAFFAADGTLVDLLRMEPCVAEPCERYQPSGSYRYALEAPRGAFDAIDQPFLSVEGP